MQTEPLADGRAVSPHDPLLPGAARRAGRRRRVGRARRRRWRCSPARWPPRWSWTAHRRFAVPLAAAVPVVRRVRGRRAPLAAYGAQVYPELPAALAVTVARRPRVDRPARAGAGGVVPRGRRRRPAVAGGEVRAGRRRPGRRRAACGCGAAATARRRCRVARGLAVAGVAYVVAHRVALRRLDRRTPPATTSSAASTPSSALDPDYVGRTPPPARPARRPRLRPGRVGAGVAARGARRRRARCAAGRRAGRRVAAAARRRLGHGHVGRAHHARLVVARAARSSSSCRSPCSPSAGGRRRSRWVRAGGRRPRRPRRCSPGLWLVVEVAAPRPPPHHRLRADVEPARDRALAPAAARAALADRRRLAPLRRLAGSPPALLAARLAQLVDPDHHQEEPR